MSTRKRLFQSAVIVFVQALMLVVLTVVLPGLRVNSLISALIVAAAFLLGQSLYWWVFISFLTWLPVWLFPLLTFLVSGLTMYILGNFVDGIYVANISTGIWVTLWLTMVNAILGWLLSIDMDAAFDRNVTQKLVKRRSQPIESDVPGFLFLEIDGLSEKEFRRALDDGQMPTLARWLKQGSHRIQGWETDFTAQTGSMQPGILLGNNDEIPAYRWWNRNLGRIEMSSDPRDIKSLEERLSNGRGLLAEGGASRGNMYSGDAHESLLTYSTILNKERDLGPGFYTYLVSPYIIARLIIRYFADVVTEWWQAWQQRRRKDKYIISARTPLYAFFRSFLGPFIQDLVTYITISDVLRGIPAIYTLYAAYDDLGHFAGMHTPEAYEALEETDHYFARIEKALAYAPRPYHIVILSDHGLSEGPTFQAAYGVTFEKLVKSLIKGDEKIISPESTHESWDSVNAFLNESINADTRTAKVLRTALRSRLDQNGLIAVGPGGFIKDADTADIPDEDAVIALTSGCTGTINFTDAKERMAYEEIQERHPELILGLVRHPGIGFVLVRSSEQGDMVLSKQGIHFLDDGTVEETDPLAVYSPNAAMLLRRESSFENCPDLVVNTKYDPETEVICGFENQISHHGGLGGPQNHPFIFHPVVLPAPEQPVVSAPNVYHLLRGWRDAVQGEAAPAGSDKPR